MPKKRMTAEERAALVQQRALRKPNKKASLVGDSTLQKLYDAVWAALDEEWHKGEANKNNSVLHDALQESRNQLDFEDKAVRWIESEFAGERYDEHPPINDERTLNRVKRAVAEWSTVRINK